MISIISNKITDFIYKTQSNVDAEKREVIEYGAYMAISEIVKVAVLLIVSVFFDITIYVLGVIFIFGFLRMTLGGVHAKTQWGCIITYSCFIYSLVVLSLYLDLNRLITCIIVIPFSFYVAYKYAPADMPQKPVVSRKQRKKLRIIGFSLLAIYFTAAQFVDQVWFNIFMLTSFLQAVLMTPLIYRLTKNKYGTERG